MIINTLKEQMNTTYSQHVCPLPTFKSVILLNKARKSHEEDLSSDDKVILITFIDLLSRLRIKTKEH